ncbi:bactofilin family protein [Pelosinus propionicus]|uniref:Polymer-forming protein n=1 Tax=Pelosinus propionicus DSM 13327 TaxID=1123291 RepID=A0A1I4KXP0_9FIRM|nr:polymer-forming cytoskeletal protein [Pelosinus propionicus]SFL83363.1 Polymer-forming protein [Pelosinus propionicus DSM 13327]
MFGSNKKVASFAGEIETIIGKDTMMKGTITGKGALRIDGQFEGDINTTGSIVIGENAKVTAQCKGMNATIAGVVYGNIDISEKLELLPTSQIYGDIKAGILSVGEGAIFKGACEMHAGAEDPANKKNIVKKQ